MAIVTGGDITEIAWSNPLLGSGFLYPIAGEESTFCLGGFTGDDDKVVDGAGRLINSLHRVPWDFKVKVANDMVNTREFEAMVDVAGSTEDTTWTISVINGAVYKAQGTIQGRLELNGSKSAFELMVVGGGTLGQ
jgi:hypothetical protein